MEKEKVFVSIGSNLGDRESIMMEAIQSLFSAFDPPYKISNLYASEPWGFESKDKFLNCCVEFSTSQLPREVLRLCQSIEQTLGRIKKTQNNQYVSRTIDIDMLYFGSRVINEEALKVPHPLLHERNFVLYPLAEIAPNFEDPKQRQSVKKLKKESKDMHIPILFKMVSLSNFFLK